jgi:hypothetical protein
VLSVEQTTGRRREATGREEALAYPAKRDWWVACLVVPGSLSLVGIGAVIAYQVVTQAMPPGPGLLGAAVPAAIGGLLLWLFSGTSYEIGDTHLITRLGPFRFRVPLDAIEEVVSTTGFRVVIGLGLAWSLDMLHVKYRKASGRRAFPNPGRREARCRMTPSHQVRTSRWQQVSLLESSSSRALPGGHGVNGCRDYSGGDGTRPGLGGSHITPKAGASPVA